MNSSDEEIDHNNIQNDEEYIVDENEIINYKNDENNISD
jgi:hypothetical protein